MITTHRPNMTSCQRLTVCLSHQEPPGVGSSYACVHSSDRAVSMCGVLKAIALIIIVHDLLQIAVIDQFVVAW